MMSINSQPRHLKFCRYCETRLENIRQDKAQYDSIIWSELDDKRQRKQEQINDKIEKLRDKATSEIRRNRKHDYGVRSDYTYKSQAHKEQFLEIAKAAKLSRQEQKQEKQISYDIVDGFCHSVSIPKLKVEGKQYVVKLTPKEIESNFSLGLGSKEGFLI
jgi:hypothetical protein